MQPPVEFKLENVLAALGFFVAWIVGNLIANWQARRSRASVLKRASGHVRHEHCKHEGGCEH